MQKEKPHISVNHDERRFTQIRGQSNTLIFIYYTIIAEKCQIKPRNIYFMGMDYLQAISVTI